MAHYDYDLLVIGAGAAGSSAVTTIDTHNLRVGLVERHVLGGTCLNYGCDPTKTLLHIANERHHAQHAGRYGLRIPEAAFVWVDVQSYVQQVIKRLRGGTLNLRRKALPYWMGRPPSFLRMKCKSQEKAFRRIASSLRRAAKQ